MKALKIGLVAVLFMMAGVTSAFAAKDSIPPEARKAGMAAAPGLVSAAQLPCTLADARQMGAGQDDKGKITFYEVACTGAIGYILIDHGKSAAPTALNCVMAAEPKPDGKPSTIACQLPGNANPAAGLSAYANATGRACTVDKGRYIGSTPDLDTYEVTCSDGSDLVVEAPKKPAGAKLVKLCAAFGPETGVKCELTTAVQQGASVDQLVTAAGKDCASKGHRWVGATADQTDFYEVACTSGKGYMVELTAAGKVQQAIDCVQAVDVAGGCTLTDTRQAQTQQNAIYTDLAKKAGFDCAVSKYAEFQPRADGAEVVELACSNRADGGVGFFPPKGAAEVQDCLRAGTSGYVCTMSDVAPLFPKLSEGLKAKGKGSCTVSGARPFGVTSAGAILIEVACSDGGPGWVMEFAAGAQTPTELLNCAQVASAGGCQLPTNKGKGT